MQENLEAGLVDQTCLDVSSGRIIALGEKSAKEKALRKIQYTEDERIAISQEIEEEAIVLLKNNGVLPLTNETISITGLPVKSISSVTAAAPSSPTAPSFPWTRLCKIWDWMCSTPRAFTRPAAAM